MGRPEERRSRPLAAGLFAASILVTCAAARAAPVFVPGLYESESRSAASPDQGTRKRECLASPDATAFARDMLARFGALPQFRAICKLSASKPTPDGFAFAMDCGTAKTIVTYRLAPGLVHAVVETSVAGRPDKGSTIVTLSRRIGACPSPRPSRASDVDSESLRDTYLSVLALIFLVVASPQQRTLL